MKNSRVWSCTYKVDNTDHEFCCLLAPSVEEALKIARQWYPDVGPIRVKVINSMNREQSIEEARRRKTLYEVAKKQDLVLTKSHEADVVVVQGKIVKNRFGRVECDILRLP
jgi:hypothetical protein